MRKGGQTERQAEMTKLIIAFRNFVNATNKGERNFEMNIERGLSSQYELKMY